jgi:hypothetical protein
MAVSKDCSINRDPDTGDELIEICKSCADTSPGIYRKEHIINNAIKFIMLILIGITLEISENMNNWSPNL